MPKNRNWQEPPRAPQPAGRVAQQRKPFPPHVWFVLALWAAALAAYSNSFQGGMVFDNAQTILRDSRVHAATSQNVHLIWNEDYWYGFSTTGLYRPLATFSFLMNYSGFGNGANPAGYHWVNFALHTANILLVYLLGLLILEQPIAACALAALWGLHPLLTESVTNLVGRADMLACLGVLGGLLCHVAAARAIAGRRVAWLAGVGAFAALGIFSKESAVVLPAVLLLYDCTWDQGWRRRAGSYLALGLPFVVFFTFRAGLLSRIPFVQVPFVDNPLNGVGFLTARITAIKVIGKYFWLWIWPAHLSSDYSFNSIPLFGWRIGSWEDWKALIALAGCLACMVLAVRWFRTRKAIFFFLVFFFLTLAPTSNVFLLIGTDMAERFVYLPSIGIAAILVLAVQAAGQHFAAGSPRARLVPLGAICLIFAVRTYTRNFDWRSERSLWTTAVAANPESSKAHAVLASTLAAEGRAELDHAVAEADRTLAILEGLPDEQGPSRAFATAGECYRLKGDSIPGSEGATWYAKALPVLLRGQRADAAEREQIRSMNLAKGRKALPTPWAPLLYLELGRIYLRLHEPQKALAALTEGQPRSYTVDFTREIARATQDTGDWERAATLLIEGMVVDPNSAGLASDLVDLYGKNAPGSCAVKPGEQSINMECPLVQRHVCGASRNVSISYRRNGDAAKAADAAATAIRDLGCPAAMFQ